MDVRPSRAHYRELAAAGGLVPLWCDLLADRDTPVTAFAALRGRAADRFLLESVVGGERWARYSFVGNGCRARVTGRYEGDTLVVDIVAQPGFSLPPLPAPEAGLERVRTLMAHHRVAAELSTPRFCGGLVGVWGHDWVRCLESLPRPAGHSARLPAFELLLTDTVVAFDNLAQTMRIYATACPALDGGVDAAYDAAVARMTALRDVLLDDMRPRPHHLSLVDDVPHAIEPAPPWTEDSYRQAIEKARRYITEGDIFQVVLSRRFELEQAGVDPLDVYRILRVTNPAPYMYFLELPSATLAGASPELLVRVDRDTRRVTVRPIAGTRPRSADAEEDLRLERELLADPKERAEHLMLVDLGRNDVGRVSAPGSVRMQDSFAIERYSRVMHIVSEVAGTLAPGLDALDALAATFPAGTLSGAPKVRALEIIDELEAGDRGWYGGAVGYWGYDGGADFAICIRSVVAMGGQFAVQAGGGIVHDSTAAGEDKEARDKASAVLRAIAMARAGTKAVSS